MPTLRFGYRFRACAAGWGVIYYATSQEKTMNTNLMLLALLGLLLLGSGTGAVC
jgi:hypothetical protein